MRPRVTDFAPSCAINRRSPGLSYKIGKAILVAAHYALGGTLQLAYHHSHVLTGSRTEVRLAST
jgi:hypothetical protein